MLPKAVSTGELPLPAAANYDNLAPKPKRKLGPLSAELERRIRMQKSATTLAKFRAIFTDGQNEAEKAEKQREEEEFPDSNMVSEGWGVRMIHSRLNPERVIFKRSEKR